MASSVRRLVKQVSLTTAQRGIWFAHHLAPDAPMSISACLEFHDPLRLDLLAEAGRRTASDTETPLTRLREVDADLVLEVDHTTDMRIDVIEFGGAADPRAAAETWMRRHGSRRVDLLATRLVECYLLRLAPDHLIFYCWAHHMVCDGFAATVMFARLGEHYGHLVAGTEAPPLNALGFDDMERLDRDYRASDQFDLDRAFWAETLGDDAEPFRLSDTDAPPAAGATVESTTLSEKRSREVRAAADALGVRVGSLMTAAFGAYLAAVGGREHATISLPVAARRSDDLRRSAGMQSNVLPIEVAASPARGVGELIVATNDAVRAALRHQQFRHEDISREFFGDGMGLDHRGFFGPMVNVMMFFTEMPFGDVIGEVHILATGPVEDMSLNVYEGLDGVIRIDLEANPNLYPAGVVRGHHERFVGFLHRMVSAGPATPLGRLDTVTPDERHRAVDVWNATAHRLPAHTLLDLLDEGRLAGEVRTGLTGPDLQGVEQVLTHRELHDRGETIARRLVDAGVDVGDVVAVSLPRSVEQVVAILGVVRAGAAYLPVDPADPDDRVENILSSARPVAIITTAPAASRFGGRAEPVTVIDIADTTTDHAPEAGSRSVVPPRRAVRPSDPAYVLFTSGSTGRPKGVVVPHEAIVNRLRWMHGRYGLTAADVVLQKTPATFDVSVWEFFWPMTIGATLAVATPDGHRDPWYLRAAIARYGVTVLHFVPSMLAAFTATFADDAGAAGDLGTVRLLFTSGEALAPGTVARWAALGSAPVHNLYGPTEAAVDVTHWDSCDPRAVVVPIGRPVWNTTAHVLDRRLRLQAPGQVGELYLGGIQLARGYIGRPDLTADRFIADPFVPGRRMYRTGDLARHREDGVLEYLGRSDFQVKIRGQRVELPEIEAAMRGLDSVLDAVVVATSDADRQRLVGYLTTGSEATISPRTARDRLAEVLPAFMVPDAVVCLDAFPTTANGKLDRAALPPPDPTADLDAGDVAAGEPVDATERAVAEAFARTLGIESAPMTAGFFELGGNSLMATQLAMDLAAQFGRRVTVTTVFDAPTPRQMARELGGGIADRPLHSPTRVRAAPRPVRVPLSPAQQRLWFLNRIEPTSGVYNLAIRISLQGALDTDAMCAALLDVVAKHESLRTVYPSDPVGPHQKIVDVTDPTAIITTTDAATDDDDEFATRGFDLAHDLPLRARLSGSGDTHELMVVLHHIAADGWSLRPLAADLAAAHRARVRPGAPSIAPLAVQYADYTLWHRARIGDETEPGSLAARELAFWSEQLADLPAEAELPRDRPRSATTSMRGRATRIRLSADTHQRLRDVAADAEVGMFMVVHALAATLLRLIASEDDIVVGTPVAGRPDRALDDLVGMFVNTVVLRVPVAKSDSFLDILDRCRAVDVAAIEASETPFDRIVELMNPPRSDTRHPLFQVSVALDEAEATPLDLEGVRAVAEPVDTGLVKFDLDITASETLVADGTPGGITVRIGYATDLFADTTMTEFGARLALVARAVATDPTSPVGDIGVLHRHEQVALVPAAGQSPRRPETYAEMIADVVGTDPDHVAVRYDGRSIAYAELDERANALARMLVEHGVGPERYVAIAIARSVEWIVATWAVTKAGAAWVPIDLRYPRERIAYLLSDSGARVVLVADDPELPLLPSDRVVLDLTAVDTVTELAMRSDDPLTDDDRVASVHVDNPAYLIYTSGTTGTPKGVVVSHRGLVNFAAEQVIRFDLTAQSRTLHFASPSFDASILESLMAVGSGATMVIAPPHVLGGRELADLLRDEHVTHAFITPAVLATLPPGLPDLAVVVVGGEAPNPETVAEWAAHHTVHNAYGPTESTVVATISDPVAPGDAITIGRPIRGTDLLVLDERLAPVPTGAIGELYLSGSQLARGYHGRLGRTSQAFVANPYSHSGDRMYRTGDLVRWNGDGELDFVGRADSQVKVRGFRIELGEIDAALVRDDAVAEAATITRVGPDGTGHLISYVRPATDDTGPIDIGALRDRIASVLPSHMVPSAVVALPTLPRTPTGKVDHRALPTPGPAAHEVVGARTAGERIVAEVFATALGIDTDEIGRATSFFDIGGTSLMGTQVVAALEQLVGEAIPVRTLFDTPTVAGLAERYDRPLSRIADGEVVDRDVVPLQRDPDRPHEGTLGPLSPAGESLWFLNRLDPGSGSYNIAFAIDLTGTLDVDALAAALTDVVDRHAPLRSVYPEVGGRPVTVALPADRAVPSLSPVRVDDVRADAESLARSTFDLRTDPPLRTRLYRVADDRHELAIVIHHIAADGWSLGPLARDIGTAYLARRDHRAPQFPPLPVTYADHVDWLGRVLGDPGSPDSRHSTLIDWWTERLAGAPARAPLPVDRLPETGTDSDVDDEHRVGVVDLDLTDTELARLRETASRHDMSLFMVVHAVLAGVLARMSTDPDVAFGDIPADVVVGTPVAGRHRTELAGLVGMFVNAVTLRVEVGESDTAGELLHRVRDTDLDALSRTEIPFERVVQACHPDRVGTHHPLFQVMLSFADDAPPPIDLGGVTVATREIDTGTSRFDLEVRVTEPHIRFTYDAALFDDDTVADLAARFRVMAAAVVNPTARIGDVDLLTARERTAIPLTAATDAPQPFLLPDVMATAAADPEHTALVAVDPDDLDRVGAGVTYGDLDARSNRWARMLIGHDIGPGSVVAVAIRRSVDSITAIWAVAKTGAAFLPVDPDYPPERIAHMLADSAVSLGMTTTAAADDLSTTVRWLSMDEPGEGLAGIVATLADGPIRSRMRTRPLHLDDLAYIIFTSGSTGVPKGVAVTHRGLAAVSADQRTGYGVTADARTLHFASPSFDASVLELLLALTAGSTMVICPPGVVGGRELAGVIRTHRVTHAFITPAALATMPTDLPELGVVGVGGEACGPELIARWATDGRRMLNNYGPTEGTVLATSSRLDPDDPVTIGTPLPGAQVLVLDHRLRPVPGNTPGELYIGGAGVARGYVGRPDLTAARFIADPLRPGARMYRTGDLVRVGTDGRLRYLGRTDSQVKIRGFRVELGEIETALHRCARVTGAVVAVRGAERQATLHAYVTGTVDVEMVRRALRTRLPRHLLPTSITVVDAIPVTANGKVDRTALPEPVTTSAPDDHPHRPVRGDTERLVADTFGLAIGVAGDDIDGDTDFFDLGGTSLVANQVVAAINAHTGTDLRVRSLFDHPTVADLAAVIDAAVIDAAGGTGGATRTPQLTHSAHPRGVELAPAQRRLWFVHQTAPGSPAYNLPLLLTLTGPVDVTALHRACIDVVDRHVSLRTRYAEIDGVAMQIPDNDARAVVGDVLDVHDCDGSGPCDAVTADAMRGFDLAHEAPIRFRLHRDDSGHHGLLIVVHHLAADGWSLSIVVRDLLAAYWSRVAGDGVDRAPDAVDYLDFSEWQRAVIGRVDDDQSVAARQIAHWRAELADAPVESLLPGDRRPPAARHGRGGVVTVDVPDGLRAAASDIARTADGTVFMVLHTALVILMSRMGVGDDVVIGTPTAGRTHPALTAVVGMFVNTVALRTRLRPDSTIRDALDSVRDRDLEALANADVPFDDVVAALHPERSAGRAPLVQTILSVHDWTEDSAHSPGVDTGPVTVELSEVALPTAKFDLQFTVTGVDTSSTAPCRLSVTYATDRYDADTVERLAHRFLRVLDAVATAPDTLVGDVAIVDTAEAERLWPVRGLPGPYPRTLDALLAAAVADNPHGPAVRDQTGQYTYREVDDASNRLARHLRAHGVRTDAVVAMAIPRSAQAIIAVWAITKAGATHLPVDPDYPPARIAHMLADSGARMGITRARHLAALPDDVAWLPVDAPEVADLVVRHAPDALTPADRPPVSIEGSAYMIYTSGSTGRPKGVAVTHRGLAALADELRARMGNTPAARVLGFASPSFDASVLEMLLAVSGRSELVIAPPDIYGGDALGDFLRSSSVSHAFITPAALASVDPDELPHLQAVGVGGEAISDDLARRWGADRVLVNFYGPTEATVFATASAPLGQHPVDIGGPIRGVRVLVVDRRLHPVPAGVPGELYLIGDGLAVGYHGRFGLTATRFVACPAGIPGERMYRTGDIVRWNRDGALDYLGRTDDQVQIRGFRVEPGEIDSAATEHPAIRFAATVVAPDSVVTYVVPVVGATVPTTAAMREHLAHRVPRHMVPSAVVVLDDIPLTPSGKLDHAALPAPVVEAGGGRPPEPGPETHIADAFAEALGVDSVRAEDNFFALGGTSLMATGVVARLRDRHAMTVGVPDLFSAPTPAELAHHLADDGSAGAGFDVVLPMRTDGDRVVFAVHPAVGLAWSYAALLPHLAADTALFGLQNPTLSGEPAAESIADLAARHVREILAVAGDRPISLIGWSVGGLVAEEIAVQLHEHHRAVADLTLLDTYIVADRDGFDTEPTVADLAVEFGLVGRESVDPDLDIDGVVPMVSQLDGPYAALGRDQIAALYESYRHLAAIAARWHPRACPGDLRFVTATVDPPPGPPAIAAWDAVVEGRITEVVVAGRHAELLTEPQVSQLFPPTSRQERL